MRHNSFEKRNGFKLMSDALKSWLGASFTVSHCDSDIAKSGLLVN